MDIKLQRFSIKKERKNYYIAVDHLKKKYKILKNEYSKKFSIGDDTYMHYTIVKSGIFSTLIEPISHEEYLTRIKEVS
jgi:hypothetical protein